VKTNGEVVIKRGERQYGATYTVSGGMLHLKTHTETRALELADGDPDELARAALTEIVDGQSASK
jgi:hypothetical protein